MLQRLVDIKTDATAAFEKESKVLLVRLDDDLITLALADKATGTWEAAEILKAEAADRADEGFISTLKQNSSLINYKGIPAKVLIATAEAMAAPKVLETSIPLFFETQFGDQHTAILNDAVNNKMLIAYAPQPWQQEFVTSFYPEAQVENTLALLIQQALLQPSSEGLCLYLHVGKACVELVLVQHGNLGIAQHLLYDTADDLLYYLLNIARQFDIAAATLPLQLQGMVNQGDAVYQLLQTYFGSMHFASEANVIQHKAFQAVPAHYFTGLMQPV